MTPQEMYKAICETRRAVADARDALEGADFFIEEVQGVLELELTDEEASEIAKEAWAG